MLFQCPLASFRVLDIIPVAYVELHVQGCQRSLTDPNAQRGWIKTLCPCVEPFSQRTGASIGMQQDLYRRILDSLQEGIYFVDCDRRITYWNKGAERITGYSAEQVIGKCCADNLLDHVNEEGVQLCKTRCPLSATIQEGIPREASVFLHHVDGHRVPIHIRVAPIESDGHIIGAVETFDHNTTLPSVLERISELQKVATLDSLTHQFNRYGTEAKLQSSLHEYKRIGAPFGVLFVDIDRFKTINDQYGHYGGDQILTMVAKTLASNVRSYDHVGRWGGDEFLVIIMNATGSKLQAIANTLRALVEQSFLSLGEDQLRVTISIGATLVQETDTVETLLHRADKLLYESKAAGRNCVTAANSI